LSQIFHRSANTIARVSIFGGIFILAGLVWLLGAINSSQYITGVDVVSEQPVPFSHKHHVVGLGIDCRYCHTSVENSSSAGMPPTKTCMNCHSEMWNESPMLEPVRESFKTGKPIEWTRVNDLPDFVYFDHSIHVKKGMACTTCHGQVDQMPLMARTMAFHMNQCLACHRDPAKFIRPAEHVFDMNWQPKDDQRVMGEKLVKQYKIGKVTDCSICHR